MDLFEEEFLANSMNSLTHLQWQEILLKIEEAFSIDPSVHLDSSSFNVFVYLYFVVCLTPFFVFFFFFFLGILL